LLRCAFSFRPDKQNDVAVPATYHPVPAPDWAATPAMKPQIGSFINILFLAAIMVSVLGLAMFTEINRRFEMEDNVNQEDAYWSFGIQNRTPN
jgi:hypothetical protein